ncbi:UNVERIFIED_CONTAM: hypothetical protein NCL1_45136 [Trichonephila clavipes]
MVVNDVKSAIVCQFVPHGRTVTTQYYRDFLVRQVRRGVRDKSLDLADSAISCTTLQDHKKNSVYGSYSDVGDGKDWGTHRTFPTFRPVTLISLPRVRNQYAVGGLRHERTLLTLCSNM